VGTKNGKILALDSANKGNVVWSHLFDFGSNIHGMWILRESSAVRGKPPLIGVVVEKGGIYSFRQMDGLSGKIIESEKFHEDSMDEIVKAFVVPGIADVDGRRCVVIVTKKGITKGLPSTTDMHLVSPKIANEVFYSVQESDALQGYTFDSVCHYTYFAYASRSTLSLPGDLKSLSVVSSPQNPPAPQRRKLHQLEEFSEIVRCYTSTSIRICLLLLLLPQHSLL
jgi:hypothetical protein